MYLSTGQVQIGIILRTRIATNTLSTLHYLNGNCTWTYNITSGPTQTTVTSEGPELFLYDTTQFTFKCEVNGSVQLSGFTTVYGETYSYLSYVQGCSFTPNL